MSFDSESKIQALYGEALKCVNKSVAELTPQDIWKAMYYVLVQLEKENISLRNQINKLNEKVN